MADNTFCIAGLGNPGKRYEATRHNVGFMFLDHLAQAQHVEFTSSKWECRLLRVVLWNMRLFLVKPETFMNRSGKSVSGVAHYYDIPPERLCVIHDDIDMNLGRIKLVEGGGSGGHNGIRSIIQALGTPDFSRIKIGIGRPGNGDVHPDVPVDRFVLSDFTREEKALMQLRFQEIETGLRDLLAGDIVRAKNSLNSLK
jgi:PTH1 family peptidyl-tRNA hydrolase